MQRTIEIVTSATKRILVTEIEDQFHPDVGSHEEHFTFYHKEAQKLMEIILGHTNGYFQHEFKKLAEERLKDVE